MGGLACWSEWEVLAKPDKRRMSSGVFDTETLSHVTLNTGPNSHNDVQNCWAGLGIDSGTLNAQ